MEDTARLGERLIRHFTFEPGEIPPTLSGFRAEVGLSLGAYRALCRCEEFAAAREEAEARYLDTLTVGALLKKYDTGFVKHLLDCHRGESEGDAPQEALTVEIRVVE